MNRSAIGATVAFERVALLMKLNEKNSPGWVEHFNYPGEWVGVVYRRDLVFPEKTRVIEVVRGPSEKSVRDQLEAKIEEANQ